MGRSRGLGGLLVAVCAVALTTLAMPVLATAATTETMTFTTPGSSFFTVPVGVTSLEVTAIGARGGRGCFSSGVGGEGARIAGQVSVSGGQSLDVEVGGVGGDLGGCNGSVLWPGGVGGGGDGGSEGGGAGGGASLVSLGPFVPKFSSPLLVAGGGGGQGNEGAAGGNAGADGAASSKAGGGGGATEAHGGAGGTLGPCANGVAGSPGTFAMGGDGGSVLEGAISTSGGGGGGGGYYGGGGGAACPSYLDPGGGGGGGSSFAAPAVTNVSGPTLTTVPASVSITYGVPLATLSGPGLSGGAYKFATQAQGTLGSAELLTVGNEGSAPLLVSGLSLSGANPDDYLLDNRCQQPEAPGSNSCQIAVRFAPQAEGASAAKLTIASNSAGGDLSVSLSGVGGPLPQGQPGPAGKVELVTCKKTKKGKKTRKSKKRPKAERRGKAKGRQHCKAKLVSGPVSFKTAPGS